MKLGLLDLLACPICKHWPIILKVFNFETKIDKFERALEGLEDLKILEEMTKIIRGKGKIEKCVDIKEKTIQDDLVRYKLNFDDYIKKFNEILKNLNYIEILVDGISLKVHEKVEKIYENFISKEKTANVDDLKDYLNKNINEIYLVNWYFQRAEVQDGIMLCEKCKRWYPISESIPQMLPDNLRTENEEKKFLEKWKDKIPEDVLNDGKPFNLK
ncbi:MAG: hypothetical protein GF329_10675 [Candidatus Lokiarchaeota archaeon]|nr:hypothetical protein [Candidatus Lokiarchaeota archaeon]